jgi:glycosyltransferase involved in cell wall biosynthesis
VTALHFVVPPGVDDPARPSGGNVYDLRIAAGLRDLGWDVRLHAAEAAGLGSALAGLPDEAVVLVDGLVGSTTPAAVEAESERLRLAVLVHLPLGVDLPGQVARREEEARALRAAGSVVCTSAWTRDWLRATYDLPDGVLHVASPGTDAVPLSAASGSGSRLLSVGALTPVKGHDVLVEALARLPDPTWTWTCVGAALDVEHSAGLSSAVEAAGLADRVRWAGALTGAALEAAYESADLLVLPSRHETFGMVAAEALARGVPVLAADVGGVREALGTTAAGELPGMLVRPDDAPALAQSLRSWLTEPAVRSRLRAAAGDRRATLPGWDVTAALVAGALAHVSDAGRLR